MAKPDCQQCGACCVSPYNEEVFCDVTETDEKTLGKALVKRYVRYPSVVETASAMLSGRTPYWGAISTRQRQIRAGPLRGVEVCACALLQGSVLYRVACKVYNKRPRVCRATIQPGDRACLNLRGNMFEVIAEWSQGHANRRQKPRRR